MSDYDVMASATTPVSTQREPELVGQTVDAASVERFFQDLASVIYEMYLVG